MPVKAVYASVQDIGKNLKKTKKHYVWKFNVDGKDHILELFSSSISGKKKVMVDGKITYEGQKMLSSNFLHVINVDRSTVNVYQSGDKYDIMINGQPFSQLYSGQGRNNEYGDENASGHSYGFSKSVTSKVGDKYYKDKGLRKNAERDDYATRAKYDGDKYYTNDEKIDSWTDVDSKVSHHRRRDHNGSGGYYDEYRRNGSDENNDYDSYESRNYTRSKTFGAQNNFDEYTNRQNTHHHTNQHQLRRPSLSDNTGVGTDFDNFNKENQGNNSGTKNLQRGGTQPLTKQTTTEVKSFFDLDTSDRKTEQTSSQTKTQNQTINNDFFNFGNTTTVQQKEEPKASAPSIQKQHSMPAPVTTNDLIDFGGPNVTDINDLYKQTPQSNQVFDLTTLTGTTTTAVTNTTTATTATVTTNIDLTNGVQLKSEPERANSEPSKKDLWNSDLVSLSDIGNNNTTNNANKQPEFIQFQVPLPGTTSNTSSMKTMNSNTSFNTMSTMGMMNNNTPNMMGNMGMMNSGMNQMGMMNGGFGQPNMMQGMGFNTNMNNMNYGMNMNVGGYGMGGMGVNQGMGGFGGMYNTQMTGAGGFY